MDLSQSVYLLRKEKNKTFKHTLHAKIALSKSKVKKKKESFHIIFQLSRNKIPSEYVDVCLGLTHAHS